MVAVISGRGIIEGSCPFLRVHSLALNRWDDEVFLSLIDEQQITYCYSKELAHSDRLYFIDITNNSSEELEIF